MLTGDFVEPEQLAQLELLIVQDCHPSSASERATVVFPAAALAEVDGTCLDAEGVMRPLRKACEAPGAARPDWLIICDLARAMGAAGPDYASAQAIAVDVGVNGVGLRLGRTAAPPAAIDPTLRRTHFRGHCLEDKVSGLRDLSAVAAAAPVVVGG